MKFEDKVVQWTIFQMRPIPIFYDNPIFRFLFFFLTQKNTYERTEARIESGVWKKQNLKFKCSVDSIYESVAKTWESKVASLPRHLNNSWPRAERVLTLFSHLAPESRRRHVIFSSWGFHSFPFSIGKALKSYRPSWRTRRRSSEALNETFLAHTKRRRSGQQRTEIKSRNIENRSLFYYYWLFFFRCRK